MERGPAGLPVEPATPRSWTLSVFERLVYRGASALVTLLLAYVASPGLVSKYATVMLAVSAYQAFGDNALRQAGVTIWGYPGAREFLTRAAWISGAVGVVLVGAVSVVATWTAGIGVFVQCVPLIAVPAAAAWSIRTVTLAQRDIAGWRRIARAQVIANIASLLVAVPLIRVWSLGAASLQSLVAELGFASLMASYPLTAEPVKPAAALSKGFFLPVAGSNLYGWTQAQAERLVLALAGTAFSLGLYSVAVALARTASDAVLLGLTNSLRGQLATTVEQHRKPSLLRAGCIRAAAIGLASQVVVTALALGPVAAALSSQWTAAIDIVPLLACSAVAAPITWSVSAYILDAGEGRRLMRPQVIGVCLGVATGFTLAHSLKMGAALCVGREHVAFCLRLRLTWSAFDRRTLSLLALLLGVSLTFGIVTFRAFGAG